jgi:hypothetical protein
LDLKLIDSDGFVDTFVSGDFHDRTLLTEKPFGEAIFTLLKQQTQGYNALAQFFPRPTTQSALTSSSGQ